MVVDTAIERKCTRCRRPLLCHEEGRRCHACREYDRNVRLRRKARGVCIYCEHNLVPQSSISCRKHLAMNLKCAKLKYKKRQTNGCCTSCGGAMDEFSILCGFHYCPECLQKYALQKRLIK